MGGRVLSWVFAVSGRRGRSGRSGRRGKPQEVFALAWGIYRVFADGFGMMEFSEN